MKKRILALATIAISLFSNAQNVYVADYSDGNKYAVIDVTPNSNEYQNVRIYLKGNKFEDFIKDLKEKNEKVTKWTKVAQNEQVTDMEKKIGGATTFSYMSLEWQGNSYFIEGAAAGEGSWWNRSLLDGTSQTGRPYCQFKFLIDKSGRCYLVLFSLMDPQKFYSGKFGVETNSSSLGAAVDNKGNAAVAVAEGKSETRTTVTLKPEFCLFIPAENLQPLIEKLESLFLQFKADKKNQKAKKKLFK